MQRLNLSYSARANTIFGGQLALLAWLTGDIAGAALLAVSLCSGGIPATVVLSSSGPAVVPLAVGTDAAAVVADVACALGVHIIATITLTSFISMDTMRSTGFQQQLRVSALDLLLVCSLRNRGWSLLGSRFARPPLTSSSDQESSGSSRVECVQVCVERCADNRGVSIIAIGSVDRVLHYNAAALTAPPLRLDVKRSAPSLIKQVSRNADDMQTSIMQLHALALPSLTPVLIASLHAASDAVCTPLERANKALDSRANADAVCGDANSDSTLSASTETIRSQWFLQLSSVPAASTPTLDGRMGTWMAQSRIQQSHAADAAFHTAASFNARVHPLCASRAARALVSSGAVGDDGDDGGIGGNSSGDEGDCPTPSAAVCVPAVSVPKTPTSYFVARWTPLLRAQPSKVAPSFGPTVSMPCAALIRGTVRLRSASRNHGLRIAADAIEALQNVEFVDFFAATSIQGSCGNSALAAVGLDAATLVQRCLGSGVRSKRLTHLVGASTAAPNGATQIPLGLQCCHHVALFAAHANTADGIQSISQHARNGNVTLPNSGILHDVLTGSAPVDDRNNVTKTAATQPHTNGASSTHNVIGCFRPASMIAGVKTHGAQSITSCFPRGSFRQSAAVVNASTTAVGAGAPVVRRVFIPAAVRRTATQAGAGLSTFRFRRGGFGAVHSQRDNCSNALGASQRLTEPAAMHADVLCNAPTPLKVPVVHDTTHLTIAQRRTTERPAERVTVASVTTTVRTASTLAVAWESSSASSSSESDSSDDDGGAAILIALARRRTNAQNTTLRPRAHRGRTSAEPIKESCLQQTMATQSTAQYRVSVREVTKSPAFQKASRLVNAQLAISSARGPVVVPAHHKDSVDVVHLMEPHSKPSTIVDAVHSIRTSIHNCDGSHSSEVIDDNNDSDDSSINQRVNRGGGGSVINRDLYQPHITPFMAWLLMLPRRWIGTAGGNTRIDQMQRQGHPVTRKPRYGDEESISGSIKTAAGQLTDGLPLLRADEFIESTVLPISGQQRVLSAADIVAALGWVPLPQLLHAPTKDRASFSSANACHARVAPAAPTSAAACEVKSHLLLSDGGCLDGSSDMNDALTRHFAARVPYPFSLRENNTTDSVQELEGAAERRAVYCGGIAGGLVEFDTGFSAAAPATHQTTVAARGDADDFCSIGAGDDDFGAATNADGVLGTDTHSGRCTSPTSKRALRQPDVCATGTVKKVKVVTGTTALPTTIPTGECIIATTVQSCADETAQSLAARVDSCLGDANAMRAGTEIKHLKAWCKARGLLVGGTKQQLIERVVDATSRYRR